VAVVLDTGALIAFERGDRQVAALLEAARRRQDPARTSSGCVAQAWREGAAQSPLAWLLAGVEELALGQSTSRAVGVLCGQAGHPDVVDAHVATLASDGDLVLTSDRRDLIRLLHQRAVRAAVVGC